jgi:diguanylate cyclase (GGDEF)-like protein
VAESVRKELALISIASEERSFNISTSIGVATSSAAGERSVPALIDRADAALYEAKRQGRNRFCVAPQLPAAALQLVRS